MTSAFKVLKTTAVLSKIQLIVYPSVNPRLIISNFFSHETSVKMLLLSVLTCIQLLIKNVEIFSNRISIALQVHLNLGVKVNLQTKCTTVFFPLDLLGKLEVLKFFCQS